MYKYSLKINWYSTTALFSQLLSEKPNCKEIGGTNCFKLLFSRLFLMPRKCPNFLYSFLTFSVFVLSSAVFYQPQLDSLYLHVKAKHFLTHLFFNRQASIGNFHLTLPNFNFPLFASCYYDAV